MIHLVISLSSSAPLANPTSAGFCPILAYPPISALRTPSSFPARCPRPPSLFPVNSIPLPAPTPNSPFNTHSRLASP
jgi:hypothetical protein